MSKPWRMGGLALLLALGLLLPSGKADAATASYQYISLPNEAKSIAGETYLPVRQTLTSMRMDVTWKPEGQNKIRLTGKNNESFEMMLQGNSVSIHTGETYPLQIKNGISYLPMRMFQRIINRDIGLSGTQMLVLVDSDPNWQNVNGAWVNQKPLWTNLNAYQKPEEAKIAPKTTTNNEHTAPAPKAPQLNAQAPSSIPKTGDKLIWPTTATYVSSPYGERTYPLGDGVEKDFHTGVDIAGQQGDAIFAAAAGTVTRAEPFDSYGNCIDITHASGLVTRYAHLNQINVCPGQQVAAGQVIGTQGMTGAATGPHLHFETRVAGQAVDPDAYIHYR